LKRKVYNIILLIFACIILSLYLNYRSGAAFFIIGKWANEFQDEAFLINAKGHEIGNHSFIHPNMTSLSIERINKEITSTDAKIFEKLLMQHPLKIH